MDFFIIALSGSCGALCRYGIYLFSKSLQTDFRWATLLINLVGCFLAGLLIGHSTSSPNKHFYTLLSVGFIGSFTTFSAFGIETLALLESRLFAGAVLNIALNLFLGIGLLIFGRYLGT